jgi:hypothetical protein
VIKNGQVDRQCEFLTHGHISEPHGTWHLAPDESELTVTFNYLFDEVEAKKKTAAQRPLHPTKLDRNGLNFEGIDDKGEDIVMEHVKSLIKNGRDWDLTPPM